MSDQTGIEWADSTFNPWIGCTKISPACDHCYAERDTKRFGRVEWGPGKPRVRTSEANWRKPLQWHARSDVFRQCGSCGWRGDLAKRDAPVELSCPSCGRTDWREARRRVFCASLADVFDNEVDPKWRADLIHLIFKTPSLDWLLLTKRIGNAHEMLERAVADVSGGDHSWSHQASRGFRHLWLGATICNQAEADRDIPKLLAVPAAGRFLSIEPMVGAVLLNGHDYPLAPGLSEGVDWLTGRTNQYSDIFGGDTLPWRDRDVYEFPADALEPRIHWVICGGESGPHARPIHPFWVRSVRDQCAEAGVPFLFKQWGEWAPRAGALYGSGTDFQALDPGCTKWPQVIRLGEHGFDTRYVENCNPMKGEEAFMQRVGKKAAGRELDGTTHTEYPQR